MAQKVIWHPNMAPSFLLLHVITNEKSLKFTEIGRLLSASRASPQKHVPTTLVGIPVDIYTLVVPTLQSKAGVPGRKKHSLLRDKYFREDRICYFHWKSLYLLCEISNMDFSFYDQPYINTGIAMVRTELWHLELTRITLGFNMCVVFMK